MGNYKTPLQAIRSYCLDCSCGSANTVKECSADDCSLHPYRFGKNPFYKSNMTDERLRKLRMNGQKLAEWNKSKAAAINGINGDEKLTTDQDHKKTAEVVATPQRNK